MSALRQHLDATIETALGCATASRQVAFGPIPLNLRGDSQADLNRIADHLAPADPLWHPATVVTVTANTIAANELPEPMQPTGTTQNIFREPGFVALSSGEERSLWILDSNRKLAVRWVNEQGDLPLWEHISPLRSAARWCAAEHDAATMHAGAVANDNGAVLIVGDAGAGKSTTTMACYGTSLDVLGDDFCFVQQPTESEPAIAHAMYRLAKLDDHSLALLPHLRQRITGAGLRGKSLIQLDPPRASSRPVRAVCHVVQDQSKPTSLTPMSRVAALRAVAPSTMFQVRLFEHETWAALSKTVRSVPCYRLSVSRLADVAALLDRLLSGAHTPTEEQP